MTWKVNRISFQMWRISVSLNIFELPKTEAHLLESWYFSAAFEGLLYVAGTIELIIYTYIHARPINHLHCYINIIYIYTSIYINDRILVSFIYGIYLCDTYSLIYQYAMMLTKLPLKQHTLSSTRDFQVAWNWLWENVERLLKQQLGGLVGPMKGSSQGVCGKI